MNETQLELEKRLGCPDAQLRQARANLESAKTQVIEALKRVASRLTSHSVCLDHNQIGKVTVIDDGHIFVELDKGLAFEVKNDGWLWVDVIRDLADRLNITETQRLYIEVNK